MITLSKRRNKLLGLIIILGFLLAFGLLLTKYPLTTAPVGYISAYQGAHPSFYAVVLGQDIEGYAPDSSDLPDPYSGDPMIRYERGSYFTADGDYLLKLEGYTYTGEQALDKIGALDFGISYLYFDLDHPQYWLPNIEGEMTDIVVPESSVSNILSLEHLPREWVISDTNVRNPVNVYEWEIENDDGSIDFIRMEEWVLYWYVSIEATWDTEGCCGAPVESDNRRYHNLEIWFRIDLNKDNWYFEEQPDNVYFAIAKIQVVHVKLEAKDESLVDITPESAGSYLPIYLGFRGQEYRGDSLYTSIISYKDRKLNPTYFRDTVYTKIILNDFGTQEWYEFPLTWKYKADVVTYGFKVHVFVIGDWKVQNVDDIPDDYGRKAKFHSTSPSLLDFLAWMGMGLSNPLVLFLLILIAIVVLFILIVVFAPWLLTGASKIMSRRG